MDDRATEVTPDAQPTPVEDDGAVAVVESPDGESPTADPDPPPSDDATTVEQLQAELRQFRALYAASQEREHVTARSLRSLATAPTESQRVLDDLVPFLPVDEDTYLHRAVGR